MATGLSYAAVPVYYGSDRNNIHLGMTRQSVLGAERSVVPLDNSGLCWRGRSDRYPVYVTTAQGVSVTCADCIEEANRRQAAKEVRDGSGLGGS